MSRPIRYPVGLRVPIIEDTDHRSPLVGSGPIVVADDAHYGGYAVPPPRVIREYLGERREIGRHVLPDSGARRVVSVTEFFVDEYGNRTPAQEVHDPLYWGGNEIVVADGPVYGQAYPSVVYPDPYPVRRVPQYPVGGTQYISAPSRGGYGTQPIAVAGSGVGGAIGVSPSRGGTVAGTKKRSDKPGASVTAASKKKSDTKQQGTVGKLAASVSRPWK